VGKSQSTSGQHTGPSLPIARAGWIMRNTSQAHGALRAWGFHRGMDRRNSVQPDIESPHKRARVLVVDDVPTNIRLLTRVLADEHDVMAATSGEDALLLAGRELPDLILLDVEMPDLDGYAVCRQLKSSPSTSSIPVIFVTARTDEADEVEGLRLGAVDYITKPFREAIVRARVQTHLELKRYRDLLQDRSYIDGLTGVPNRRRFDEFLERAWSTARSAGLPLSLLMIDVDHFKAYNDSLGHLAGDECLRRVAAALPACVRRDSDLLARYGGEEFACVLPGAADAIALKAGQCMQARVLSLDIPHPQSSAGDRVTVSVGVGSMAVGEPLEISDLIERADRALYQAKQDGRNRVRVG